MTMLHLARCDGPVCSKEALLVTTVSTFNLNGLGYPSTSHALPAGWREFEGQAFCSLGCLGNYALDKERAGAAGQA